MQPKLFEYFRSEKRNGFLQDCSINLINKTNGSDTTRWEEYCYAVPETVAPYKLNRKNELINTFTQFYTVFEVTM